jgi:hypothetical protein
MDFIQERGQPLHLVQNHKEAVFEASQLAREDTDVGEIGLVERFVEQIDAMGSRKGGRKPRALSGAPGSEEKERTPRRLQEATISDHVAVIMS